MSKVFFFLSLLIILTGCSGNQALESRFAPDSQLTNNNNSGNNGNQVKDSSNNNQQNNNSEKNQGKISFPDGFPSIIPVYQPATVVSVEQNTIKMRSRDPINLILNYYQQQLATNNWQINKSEENRINATNQEKNLTMDLTLTSQGSETELTLTYSQAISNNNTNNNTNQNQTENTPSPALTQPLQELVRLGVIANTETINPHNIITRREYARWLVKTNNLLFADVNGKLIREANPNSKPVFTDVPKTDADFGIIQGLAEAGLIPSPLLKQGEFTTFNPDKPLTREDLIAWKVPLDFRTKIPNVTLDALKETWGFQDANKITPLVWGKIYLDWQNGESANIRKAFGYITLFQPQKEVTYEEAGRVLSSFGTNTDISYLKNVNPNANP